MDRPVYQLEISGETATIYLSSKFVQRDVPHLARICEGLPHAVRLVRVDLHALAATDDAALLAMRELLGRWRESRRGDVRLSFRTPHIVATFSADASAALMPSRIPGLAMAREALMAAYL